MGNSLEIPLNGEVHEQPSESDVHSNSSSRRSDAPEDPETHDLPSSRVFECNACDRHFTTSKGLKIHQSHHVRLAKRIASQNLNRSSRSRRESILSVQTDSLERSVYQPVASESLVTPDSLNAQESGSIVNDTALLKCTLCGFIAKSKGGLKCHARKHLRSSECTVPVGGDPKSLHESIAFFKRNTRRLNQIPKGARAAAADKLSKLIDSCLTCNDVTSWSELFLFS